MPNICSTLLLFIAVAQFASAQPAKPAQPTSGQTDIYHVSFFRSAPGKAAQLADDLKGRNAKAPMPGHFLLLRHQSGDDWDYASIEHLGPKTTLDAQTTPPPASSRNLVEWHDDTFVIGPSWSEFSRAMGISGQAKTNTAGWVYVVAVHRAIPAHREQLEKILREPVAGGSALGGSVVMAHMEGGPWQYLALNRYSSWQDFAATESKSQAQTQQGSGGWFQVREHVISHRDTITHRIAP